MPLVATVGAENANSYVTVTEAETYFNTRLYSQTWFDYEYQAEVLVTASRILDWYVTWKGTKATEAQSMQWPRVGALRKDGTEISSAIVPNDVKVAVFELALSSLDEDRTLENPLAGIEQVKAGSLMVKSDGADPLSTKKKVIPEKVWKILSDVCLRNGIGIVRLMRA